ncbi:hypothetical protein [Neobacillus terrae]|uniref:hypothetical protein n=1 Tax=Neobacillus terrae TaxID=3034837 RepID=UPI00140D79DB|nr:hypothetical protein [Neobacillus terrae]NHM30476.1 hypothetical protein [Neobacillus terrae]
MRFYFSKKEKWILSVLSVMLVAFVGLGYICFIQPAKADFQIKQQSLQTQKQILNAVLEKRASVKNSTVKSTTELQKLLPVKPFEEQLVVDLGKAEVVSNSTIKTMTFSEGSGSLNKGNSGQETATNNSANPVSNNANTTQSTTVSGNVAAASNTTEQGQSSNPQQSNTPLPAGIEKVTVDMNIESSTYEDLEKFLTTLENQKRITVIEKINFTGTKEITSLEDTEGPLNYNVTFSAFYMPGLKDLEDELPRFETPPPSNKRNPLSKFADTGDPEREDSQNN